MKVMDLMQKKVFTVTPDDKVDRVFFLIHYEGIRHLPVVEGEKVVGIVSDRDLYKALGPKKHTRAIVEQKNDTILYVSSKKVCHIMRRGVITIHPEDTIKKTAIILAKKKIGALPVVKDNKLVGIITATDLLMGFSKLDIPEAKV
jgi:acetoin utilization protein AcuB